MKLKEIRTQKGVKSKDIADFLGVAKSTMSLYESGRRQMDYATLSKTAQFLGVSVGELLGVEESNPGNEVEFVEKAEKEKSPSSADEELEKQVMMMRSMLGALSEEDRKKVLRYANSLFQDMI